MIQQDPIFLSTTSKQLLDMLSVEGDELSSEITCKKKNCCKKYKRKGKHCKKCPKI
ncbi:hypothetical protein [Flammeovirga sp. EKP202]|uniref:hypothetical protein n=1 Tax=Flammeovirga sp. EKP202 TaxID=2770592 RepID=UPI00165F843F|nr:hypothetical protein [Flammeovirga sp. EKP202]MBD0401183.1 hypothetical protein [Flammeovirga sp. EKP202]